MSQWYFARQGQQRGPVPESELHRLAANGEFDPLADLVWRDGMKDWLPASNFPELQPRPQPLPTASPVLPASPRSLDPSDPYAAPASNWHDPVASPLEDLAEIPPGSEPLDITGCIKQAFELTKRHFGVIVATGAIYLGITVGLGMALGFAEAFANGGTSAFQIDPQTTRFETAPNATPLGIAVTVISNIVSQVLSIYLGLGVTRVGLNIVTGKHASPGMIFGEGSKLLRGIGAGILYALMVLAGTILLIVPGIYLGLRYSQYLTAIVDRDMGVMESLRYSASITQNNKLPLLGLYILSFLIVLAGMLALCVGLIFAYPIAWLAAIVAYRWMQVGSAAVREA